MLQKSDRLPHIALLQVLGVILVIIGHIIEPFIRDSAWYYVKYYKDTQMVLLHNAIYTFHMPLFFFISGFLFAYKNKDEESISKLFVTRFKKYIVPFYIFAITIWFPFRYFFIYVDTDTITKFVSFEFCDHLWFLPTLFITLLYYSILLKTPLKRHLLILTIIIYLVGTYYPKLSLSEMLYSKTMQNLIFVHMGYLFAKYYQYDNSSIFSKPQIKGNVFSRQYFMLITLFITKILATDLSLQIRFILNPILVIALLYVLAQVIAQVFPKLSSCKMVNLTSKNMLIIYLFHYPLVILYHQIISEHTSIPPISNILLLTPLVLLTEIVLILGYKKVLEKIKKIMGSDNSGARSEIKVAVKTNI